MDSPSRRYSFEERKIIEEMLKDSFCSTRQIASKLNRHYKSIQVEIRRSGGRESYLATEAQKRAQERNKIRRKKLEKTFSETEIYEINLMFDQRVSYSQIASVIGCSQAVIGRYFRSREMKRPRQYSKMSLLERILAIEEQISIIFETLKEMKK